MFPPNAIALQQRQQPALALDMGMGYGGLMPQKRAALLPHPLLFFFHTETTLQGAPAPPTGSTTLSEIPPHLTDANAASIAGGHQSTAAGVATSQLNAPTSKPNVGVTGEPPTVGTPASAHQFGWFSDIAYLGRLEAGTWTFQWREDDNVAGVTGHPVVNIYATPTRDFANTAMRLVAQLHGATDWWSGAAATGSWVSASTPSVALLNEYLFFQLWCHETVLSSGGVLTFHQEGSDLSNAQRSTLRTPQFQAGPVVDNPAFSVRLNQSAAQVPLVTWYSPANSDMRFMGLDDPARPYQYHVFKTGPAYFLSKTIRGVSRDSNNAILPFCKVVMMRTSDNTVVATTVSDANGNYSVTVPS